MMKTRTLVILALVTAALWGYLLGVDTGSISGASDQFLGRFLLQIPGTELQAARFTSDGTSWDLERNADPKRPGWIVGDPFRMRARPEWAQRLSYFVQNLERRGTPFPSRDQADLAELGLEPEMASVQLTRTAGNPSRTIRLGRASTLDPSVAYAMVDGIAGVHLVSADLAALASASASDWLDRRAFSGAASNVVGVEWRLGKDTIQFGVERGNWWMFSPRREPADLDRVELLLTFIDRIRTFDWPEISSADAGLDDSDDRLTVLFPPIGGELVEETLVVGGEAPPVDEQPMRYARVNDGPILRIPSELWSILPQEATDYRNPRIFEGLPEPSEIELSVGDQTLRLALTDRFWRVSKPDGLALDPQEPATLLSILRAMTVRDFIDPESADLSLFGLDPAKGELTFYFPGEGGARVAENWLLGSPSTKGDPAYLYRPGGVVYSIPPSVYRRLIQGPLAVRDRRICRFPAADIRRVEFRIHGEFPARKLSFEQLTLERVGESWSVDGEPATESRLKALERLLEGISRLRVREFLNGDDPSANLDNPLAEIIIAHGDSGEVHLRIGAPLGQAAFAGVTNQSPAFALPWDVVENDLMGEAQILKLTD